ncbi:hypothetical protein LTR85_000615 [Meristemomyces frigidus]|nr:hypothetical protein LTR85_000615 [Meristemomyces frigidus]
MDRTGGDLAPHARQQKIPAVAMADPFSVAELFMIIGSFTVQFLVMVRIDRVHTYVTGRIFRAIEDNLSLHYPKLHRESCTAQGGAKFGKLSNFQLKVMSAHTLCTYGYLLLGIPYYYWAPATTVLFLAVEFAALLALRSPGLLLRPFGWLLKALLNGNPDWNPFLGMQTSLYDGRIAAVTTHAKRAPVMYQSAGSVTVPYHDVVLRPIGRLLAILLKWRDGNPFLRMDPRLYPGRVAAAAARPNVASAS